MRTGLPVRWFAQAACRALAEAAGGRAEGDAEAVEGVHQADRIGEIGKLLVVELGRGRLIVGIGNAGFGDARHGFGPGKGGAFAAAEQIARIAPDRHQHELVDREAGLQQVARMHVDAKGAAVDLRDPQIDEIDQFLRQAAFLDGDIDPAEGLVASGEALA